MNSISRFFTLFWIIYFPTCIAYNDLPGFSSIDEVMTGVLTIYTLAKLSSKFINRKPQTEYFVFLLLLLFYIVYSLMVGVNVSESVWYDLMQQLRPYTVLFCTWILNPQFTRKQKKYILFTMIATVVTFIFYHPQLVSDSEYRNAPFGQLSICTSMLWYLFTKKSKRNTIITVLIAVVGLLGMKFKYYGQFGAWMFMIFYMEKKFRLGTTKSYFHLALLLVIVLALGWERFDAYYVEGINDKDLARPMIYKASLQILVDYLPFGPGMGTFATAASAVYYSPLWSEYNLNHIWGLQNYGSVAFHCDSFFASLAQFGVFGIFFFVWFWKRRLYEFDRLVNMRYYRVAMMCFFCLLIECFGDSSYLSGKGMGYFMLMAVCLNSPMELSKTERMRQEDIRMRGVQQEFLKHKNEEKRLRSRTRKTE